MFEISLDIALGFIFLAFFFSLIRLWKGPSLQDRVVALDLIASLAVGIILIYLLRMGEKRYLDIVLILSLIVFLGTVAIARFLNKSKNDD